MPVVFPSMSDNAEKKRELVNDLNRQTSKIGWREIQRFYAAGDAVYVKSGMDLVNVAAEVALDNSAQLKQWMEADEVHAVTEAQATAWFDGEKTVWAVVVSPWVFVQPID